MGIKAILTDLAKRSPALREVMRRTRLTLSQASYRRILRRTSVDDRLILFESFGGRSYACSPKALYLAMLEDARFDRCRFVWAFSEPESKALPDSKRTALVKSGSQEYYEACASAKMAVINSSYPERIIMRPEQLLIETWHGTPLKRLGCDITVEGSGDALNGIRDNRRRYMHNSRRFTRLLSPSPYCSEKLASAFDLGGQGKEHIITELGYPRNDFLFNYTPEEAARVRARLGIPEGKRVLLYAPTYRDNSHDSAKGYIYENPLDLDRLRETLGEQWVVLFRAHYFVANTMNLSAYAGFVWDVSAVDDVNELYIISDALVTDYSSVLFDYANLGRPMLFYVYDKEQYEKELRGFYFDYSSLPGPITETQEELEAELLALEHYAERFGEAREQFRSKFCPLEDGRASARVLEVLAEDMGLNG